MNFETNYLFYIYEQNLVSMRFFITIIIFLLILSCKHEININQSLITDPAETWWKEAIVYQIYPRSFKDTNGDGIGDLQGIIQSLDYVKSLGVTAVWLNPIYSSPNDDNGYDVSDYRNIMTDFGTMEDFDLLVSEMHKRDLKLIMDIVVNHSSDEHDWFKQSRSSRDNPYRDYYHWWPAEKCTPNYRYSLFDPAGDAWKYDSLTNAYYLHYFSPKQPDLNWSNPKVRKEVNDIMIFWAEKGVDGFRLDAFQFAAKDTTFPAFPEGYEKDFIQYYDMQEGVHDYLKGMNEEVFSKYNLLTVSEGAGRNFKEAHELVDADRGELQMAYAFEGVDIPKIHGYELATVKEVFSNWDREFSEKGWLSIFLSNHDQARMVSRWGNDSPEFRALSTKMLNTFIMSMRGTPYAYYGDELGMTNIDMGGIEDYQDVAALGGYERTKSQGGDMDVYMAGLQKLSRENGRTPMQWDSTQKAGFSNGTSWMLTNPNSKFINVAQQESTKSSVLNHFRQLTNLRKSNKALIYGAYKLVQESHPDVYAYTRSYKGKRFLVVLNFKETETNFDLKTLSSIGTPLLNNYFQLIKEDDVLKLKPYQSLIFELTN